MPVANPITQISLKRQLGPIEEEINNAVSSVINKTAFIGGKVLEEFENHYAEYCQTKYCIGVGNGTDALHSIFWALELNPGDEVIVPAMSFIATVEPLIHQGLKPVFVDIDPETANIDVSLIEQALSSRTRAILPVHLYGQPADMDSINAIAQSNSLYVIEDAAQAHGAYLNSQRTGSLGHAAAFSFYPSKNLGAFGDGGAITTSDSELEQKIRRFTNHGRSEKNTHDVVGINSRLDGIQAAVLSVKLKYLDQWNKQRAQWANLYTQGLSKIEQLVLPTKKEDRSHVYHQYVIQSPDRDRLRDHLSNQGIQTGLHYPTPLHLHPAFNDLGYASGQFPNAERLAGNGLSLPMYAELTEDEVQAVIASIRSFYQ